MPCTQIAVGACHGGTSGDGAGWLFMSGYTDDEVLLRGISRGEVAIIHKPFKRHQLAEAIARVVTNASKGE